MQTAKINTTEAADPHGDRALIAAQKKLHALLVELEERWLFPLEKIAATISSLAHAKLEARGEDDDSLAATYLADLLRDAAAEARAWYDEITPLGRIVGDNDLTLAAEWGQARAAEGEEGS